MVTTEENTQNLFYERLIIEPSNNPVVHFCINLTQRKIISLPRDLSPNFQVSDNYFRIFYQTTGICYIMFQSLGNTFATSQRSPLDVPPHSGTS